MKKVLVLLVIGLLLGVAGYGQGFVRFYEFHPQTPNLDFARIYAMKEMSNGNIAVLGEGYQTTTTVGQVFLVIYDKYGNVLYNWENSFDSQSFALTTSSNGNLLVAGALSDSLVPQNLVLLDSTAVPQNWNLIGYTVDRLGSTRDGGFLGSGFNPNPPYEAVVVKMDNNIDTIWSFVWDTLGTSGVSSILVDSDENYLFAGIKSRSIAWNSARDPFVLKLDSLGNLEWLKTYYHPDTAFQSMFEIIEHPLSGYILYTPQRNYFIHLNDQGDSISTFTLPHALDELIATDDGGFLAVKGNTSFGTLMIKYDSQFNVVWQKNILQNLFTIGMSGLSQAQDNGYLMYSTANTYYGLIVKTDSSGILPEWLIHGKVVHDSNLNCTVDSVENGLENQIIQLSGNSNYFAYTNDQGEYELRIYDNDSLYVSWADVSPYWSTTLCQGNFTIFPFLNYDTIRFDIFTEPLTLCPDLTVSLNTSFHRRCFQSTIVVNYCNQGTLPANNAYLEIELDPYLTVDSASIPWASNTGNLFRFNLDTLNIGQCGSFNLYVTVDCDSTVLGQTHCISAHIYPDSICLPTNPDWDGSSIKVTGECVAGDTLDFKIENVGTGDMATPSFFLIAEDNVMFQSGSFELLTGESLTRRFAGNGSTFTLIANQAEGHPVLSYPMVSIEGCGTNAQGTFSTGFKTQYPQDDQNGFVDILCLPNIGAYDPNDKRAEPQGLNSEGYITATQPLDYTIRFQNTGTDTAFTVVIRDTLSAHLDITTLQLNAASHNYTFQIIGSDVLEWTFPNILLPDSNVNEPLSHGFVSFSISQMDGNAPGTEITNSAGIYFDFNAPIITNTTLNTVIADYKTWFTFIQSPESKLHLGLFPNPNNGTFSITFDAKEGKAYEFVIFDLAGARQFGQSLNGQAPFVLKPELSTGMYIYQLLEDGAAVGMGKVLVHK